MLFGLKHFAETIVKSLAIAPDLPKASYVSLLK